MLSQIRTNFVEKLRDKTYRHKFFKGRAEDEVASKLIEFRKKRGLSQAALARLCGMKQSAVSRLEKASYSRWSFATLWRVAKALDVRVQVTFADMADVIREYELRYSDQRPSFEEIANNAATAGVVGGMSSSTVSPELVNPITMVTYLCQARNPASPHVAVRGIPQEQAFCGLSSILC